MQENSSRNRVRKSFSIVFLAAIMFGGFSLANAQTGVLADGNPPLTSRMVERYTGLLEWSLDVAFSPQDRAGVEKQIVKYWRTNDEKNVKGVLDALAFEQNLARAGETKKQELQPQIKQKLLETMEKERQDPLNAVLLSIYNKNQNASVADAQQQDSSAAGGATDLSKLVGKWQVLHGNSIVGVDINSGRIGDGNSMIAQYHIQPDGRVIFSLVLQQSNYGCTTRIKTSKTGRLAVDGSRATFVYDGGTTTSEDSCNAKHNYTKKLAPEKETFNFNLKPGANGKTQFCFANDKLKDCAVKIN